jgi:hypothetical protein
MEETLTLRLDRFGHDALDAYVRGSRGSHAEALETAVSYYLADSGSGRAGWPVPRAARAAASGEEIEVELDDRLYGELELEARRQGLAPGLLAGHAVMYFLADVDAGRAAARLGDAVGGAEAR